MDIKRIDNKYRPVPFWSWNERLNVPETIRQVALMDQAGMGGFFMHARGGLQTEYMGKEWFDQVTACVEESQKREMYAWAYDENGWPSGFGGGLVNGKGLKYQQKYLRRRKTCEMDGTVESPRVLCHIGDYCYYYDVNPFYVDTLDGEVIADFIREIYEPYEQAYGNTLAGFFTDEPQISRAGIPWSFVLPDAYETAYGESLCPRLNELFEATGDYRTTRMRFWKLVTELFSKNFMKQIYDWCQARGLGFTGHMVLEETFHAQLTSNGACMPHYEYFTIPGMDWLCRPIYHCLTLAQLCSAAAQTGKRQILSETFALCGHNVGHDELKRNYEWMMVRGVNLMCQHLEGYSLRGIRKRDYPPAMYYQQPWWPDYKQFNDAMSRIGMLLCEGEIRVDTLVMHTQTTAWMCYDDGACEGMGEYQQGLLDVMRTLDEKHILYHLGDEILIERHGRVEGNIFVIGKMRYSKIILPPHISFLPHTDKLLAEFVQNGGCIVTADELAPDPIIDNPAVTYTMRDYPAEGATLRYFVNSTDQEQVANIACGGLVIDPATGEMTPFGGKFTFPKWGSLLLWDDGSSPVSAAMAPAAPCLDLGGEWRVVNATENALTLDRCDYWFDGQLQEEQGYILNVGSRALELGRPVEVTCRYTVRAEYLPERLYLVCETPEIFDITINGVLVDTDQRCGYFRDISFVKLDVSGLLHTGENVIETRVLFAQSETVYENMNKAKQFESEKNKLTFDMEMEAMYLVGKFGVKTDGTYEEVDHDAAFYDGAFVITEPPEEISLCHIERQGYPFFAGELTVEKTLTLAEGDTARVLTFDKTGINAVRVNVDGTDVGTLLWRPYRLDLSPDLHAGDQVIRLTLVNNLRNLLGPHHHTAGELWAVGPGHFYKEPCIWTGYGAVGYTETYCFVHTSIFNERRETI